MDISVHKKIKSIRDRLYKLGEIKMTDKGAMEAIERIKFLRKRLEEVKKMHKVEVARLGDHSKKPILIYDKEGKFLVRRESLKSAAEFTGLRRETISKALLGKSTCRKFNFKYAKKKDYLLD